ncbi:terpene synthase family protein [Allokutzneria multivorans]|uniref:terpene synthase family protein n=1 Tax=Allokutzneria multivorans TaxID=1142134 RepID=UPI0031EC6041
MFENTHSLDVFLRGRHGAWAGFAHPSADLAWATVVADVFQFWFLLDDVVTYHRASEADGSGDFDGYSSLFDDLRSIMAGSPPRQHSVHTDAFRDLFDRARTRLSAEQQHRFISYIEVMLDGFVDEIALRACGGDLDFDGYMDLHRRSSGMDWVYLLVERGMDVDLSAARESHPEIFTLHDVLTNTLIYGNDILGFRRDHVAGDQMNGVVVLMRHGMELQEAVNHVSALLLAGEREFVDLRAKILASELGKDPQISGYLAELGQVLVGDQQWHYVSPRYHGEQHEWNGVRWGYFELTRARTYFVSADAPE